jgi:hypothetical protein
MEGTLFVILLTILRLGVPLVVLLGAGEIVRRRSARSNA